MGFMLGGGFIFGRQNQILLEALYLGVYLAVVKSPSLCASGVWKVE